MIIVLFIILYIFIIFICKRELIKSKNNLIPKFNNNNYEKSFDKIKYYKMRKIN